MTLFLPLGASLLLLAQLPQNMPVDNTPLRNSFVSAAETVVDDSAAVDVSAEDSTYDLRFGKFQADRAYMDKLADGDREHDIVASTKNLEFLINACRLQAKNGAAPDKCLMQLANARMRIMVEINHHKVGGAWVDGPPQ